MGALVMECLNTKAETKRSSGKQGAGIFRSESASATVIAAVLLLCIVFTTIAIVRISYVPEWKKETEHAHMNEVWDDMAELKSRADMLSLFMASDPNSSAYGFSISAPMRMGGGEVPIFEPSTSAGTLSINTERCRMTITPQKPSVSTLPNIVECGGVTYLSKNREYMDQVIRYENGALILAQGERSLMKQSPSFRITRNPEGNYSFSIRAMEIIAEPDAISTNDVTSLRMTGLDDEFIYDSGGEEAIDSFTCTIITQYPDAWASYLNETAEAAGLEYDTDYTLDCPGSDCVYFSFTTTGGKNLERLCINKSVIGIELGPGGGLNYAGNGGSGDDEGGNETGGEGGDESVMELGKWYYFDTFTGTYDGSALSSGDTDPTLLEDYNEGYSLPSGVKNYILGSYSEINDFDYYVDKNEMLDLNFDFDTYDSFESNVNSATVRMIYRFEDNQEPDMEMTISGTGPDSFNPDNNNWCLYNDTIPISPDIPADLTLNLKVISTGSNIKGRFHIDYLAVRLG